MCKMLGERVLQVGSDTCIGLEDIARKREGARNSPPPSGARDSGDPGLSFGDLAIPLASMVIEIIAAYCENSPI